MFNMVNEAQMRQLEFISVTLTATVQKQQVTAAPTAASAAATGMTTVTTPSSNDGPRLQVDLQTFSGEKED